MSRITVAAFVIDDENEEKFWGNGEPGRGLMAAQVMQVLERRFAIVPNRKARRAHYLVVGRDRSGECIAIPIEPTYDPVVWRPVTAWRCKDVERQVLPRND